MYTVKETAYFRREALKILTEDEHDDFVDWIALNPLTGDVIPKTDGLRKVRWSRAGMGKRGGARVVYFNQLANGFIVLLAIHTKTAADSLSPAFLKQLKALEDSQNDTDQ
jgi:mRNA-degrading endonuclease RelE of RelBE toxin-antitoxin system